MTGPLDDPNNRTKPQIVRGGPRVLQLAASRWHAAGDRPQISNLSTHAAVVIRSVISLSICKEWVDRIYKAKRSWTSDFQGEQFSLGRAFYTHLESDRDGEYFAGSTQSDALVERTLPGMQARVRSVLASLVGGVLRQRFGFCGPGVHIFRTGGKVARDGGVVHFDVEGLTPHQIQRRKRAVSLVIMLQAPERGGGLRLWNVTYNGSEFPSDSQLASPCQTVRYQVGDALFTNSLTLHQIRPFWGKRDRISITVHAVEVDTNVWECWF